MPTWLFVIQALLIGAILFTVVPHHVLLRLQVVVWTIGVVAIAVIVGVDAQDRFYSNDQVLHTTIVRTLLNWSWLDDYPPTNARLPYILPAVVIATLGISEILALKIVSLICLLVLTNQLLLHYHGIRPADQLKTLYLTGCGLIGAFFSLLALRETMMMLLAYLFYAEKSPAVRATSLTMLMLLRPHLAIALLIGELIGMTISWINMRHRLGFIFAPMSIILSAILGRTLFYFSTDGLFGRQSPLMQSFRLQELRQVASNFVGLQFLTTGAQNINFSLVDLVILRFILSETVVIPTLFSVVVLLSGPRISRKHLSVIVAFTIYVSIATSTDFNSFRQNLPFMPLLGTVVLDVLLRRRQPKSPEPSPRFGRAETIISLRGT